MAKLLEDKVKNDNILTAHNQIRDSVSTGEIPERTLAEMAAETDGFWHYVIVTDRYAGQVCLELWKGNAEVEIIKVYTI